MCFISDFAGLEVSCIQFFIGWFRHSFCRTVPSFRLCIISFWRAAQLAKALNRENKRWNTGFLFGYRFGHQLQPNLYKTEIIKEKLYFSVCSPFIVHLYIYLFCQRVNITYSDVCIWYFLLLFFQCAIFFPSGFAYRGVEPVSSAAIIRECRFLFFYFLPTAPPPPSPNVYIWRKKVLKHSTHRGAIPPRRIVVGTMTLLQIWTGKLQQPEYRP